MILAIALPETPNFVVGFRPSSGHDPTRLLARGSDRALAHALEDQPSLDLGTRSEERGDALCLHVELAFDTDVLLDCRLGDARLRKRIAHSDALPEPATEAAASPTLKAVLIPGIAGVEAAVCQQRLPRLPGYSQYLPPPFQ